MTETDLGVERGERRGERRSAWVVGLRGGWLGGWSFDAHIRNNAEETKLI